MCHHQVLGATGAQLGCHCLWGHLSSPPLLPSQGFFLQLKSWLLGSGCLESKAVSRGVPGRDRALCNAAVRGSVAREMLRMWGKAGDFPLRLSSPPPPLLIQ